MIVAVFVSAELEWAVMVPPDATSVKMPELPPELATAQPGPSTVFQAPLMYIFNTNETSGYAEYRQKYGARGLYYLALVDVPIGTKQFVTALNFR